ncbi:unnamed protein product [Rotaria sp. Silwood2]|nr:unnamed protein product [Rotaria sp. Silwood2]CAF3020308.1 unnamed protein product [Rotaria sp. Silwood2]CAF4510548.1 unnamed protein product [Rotaria sp. Silwood2]CAF4634087.1 unnamed protein product [Rotaria sp. Silwood2]CAF4635694.1 unnamed protein product [Rotaria sp. Silwood2]
MNMNNSITNIVDLPDEVLLSIFKKLNNIDMLYSLVGINQKLENVACDITFTRAVDLITISSNELNNSKSNAILDRFCLQILSRIHNNVECLAVQAPIFQRVLHASSYPNLRKLILVQMDLNIASHIFKGMLLDLLMSKK